MSEKNGEQRSLAAQVATEIVALSEELRESNEQTDVQIAQLRSLARAIMRPNVVFLEEHAAKAAEAIRQSGDIDHRRGSVKYARAKKIQDAVETDKARRLVKK